ncbi:hypothetical protein [Streptacidiphilus anmyonensis]|uniref:hypothetical protein n=1 Tax=Streptacidiphilus anmyonensis TaxID=405782 RepID=UPI0005A9098D|nr:hypothetical protein [Streptacidiphilus anmyonensis]
MTLASVHSTSTLPSPLLSPEAREDLNRYAEAGGFTLRAETHPWYAAFASVSRLDEARAASTVLAELRGHNVPDLQQAAERLAALPDLTPPTTVRETATAVALLLRVRSTLEVLRPDAYAAEADALDALLAATATSAWRAERGVSQSWWQRTRLARRARSLTASRGARRSELHDALAETAATRSEWAALTGTDTRPALPGDAAFLDPAGPAAEAALTGLDQLTALVRAESETALADLPFAELVSLLDHLASDEGTLYRLPRLRELHDALTAQGLGELLSQLTDQQADVTATAAVIAQRTALDPETEAALTAQPSAAPAADAEVEVEVEVEADAEVEAETEPVAEAPLATEPLTEADAEVEADTDAEAEAAPLADAEVETATEPLAEAEPLAGIEGEPEADAEPQTLVEPEAVTTTQPEALAETDAQAEPAADAEIAAEAEAEAEPQTLGEAEAVTTTLPEADAETDAQPEPQAEAEPKPAADAETEAEAEAGTDAESVAEVSVATEPVTQAEGEPEADAEPQALVEAEAVTATQPEAEAELDDQAEPQAAAQIELDSDADAATEAEAQPTVEAQAEPVAFAEVEAETKEEEPQALAETAPAAENASLVEVEPATTTLPEAEPQAAEAAAEVEPQTESLGGGKPDFTPGKPVTAYSAAQLEAVVRWIDGDGVDRTDDELLRAAMKELGFSRLGPRIKDALGAAVAAARG